MPNIGYGSDKRTKYLMPDGFKRFTVSKVKVQYCHKKTERFLKFSTNPCLVRKMKSGKIWLKFSANKSFLKL